MIFDHYIIVKESVPNCDLETASIDSLAVRVRFPDLSMEYYNLRCLKTMGNRIVKTIKVDITIEEKTSGKYARVCVLVDLTKPLLQLTRVGGRDTYIKYEGMHLICFKCGVYGHQTNGCQNGNSTVKAGDINETQHVNSNSEHFYNNGDARVVPGMEFGDWMVVQKQRRGRKGK